LAAAELSAGERFDRDLAPTRRQQAVRAQLLEVTRELDESRATSFDAARERRSRRRRRPRDRFYA
jgi:hypothetical protein